MGAKRLAVKNDVRAIIDGVPLKGDNDGNSRPHPFSAGDEVAVAHAGDKG